MRREYREILRSAKEIAESAVGFDVFPGPHGNTLPSLVAQVNGVYMVLMAENPDSVVWSIVKPLGEGDASFGQVVLLCNQLERHFGGSQWVVTESLELRGVYNGSVVVRPGGVLHIMGVVNGDVFLHGDARFILAGVLSGDIELDKESLLEMNGVFSGSVEYR